MIFKFFYRSYFICDYEFTQKVMCSIAQTKCLKFVIQHVSSLLKREKNDAKDNIFLNACFSVYLVKFIKLILSSFAFPLNCYLN